MKTRLPSKIAGQALLAACGALFLSGCVFTRYVDKDGRSLTRVSVFGNQSIGKVDLTKGTMTGYSSEQAEATAALAEGLAAGLAKGLARP